jgi:bifunctional enzyme CysN/CysC
MKNSLKFITCGSVDDGKSTLIGHMLYDAKLLFTDHEKALKLESKLLNRAGEIDYSLLLDGLMAEREQGITIDVAYRYFTTEKRSFIVADCPGHEQYTRNMAVGASFADLAVILVDSTKGVLPQTKRHIRICAMMGIKHFVLAINKIDMINYSEERFNQIKNNFEAITKKLNLSSSHIIPVSATNGDNITTLSTNTPWYRGETLLEYLENIDVNTGNENQNFTMPVQRVTRPNHTFRGFQGQIESGSVFCEDEIRILPGNEKAKIKKILIGENEVQQAVAGQPVTIALDREVDISRGCVLTKSNKVETADMMTVTLLWMDNSKLLPGRNYWIKCGTKTIPCSIMKIKYKIDIETGKHIADESLDKNEIACCDISLSEKIAFEKFENNKALGGFILIDRISNMTSACGVIEHPLRRSTNIHWQNTEITRDMRAKQKMQNPITLWFTGLSGAGKSTIANEVEKKLFAEGKHTMLLDGDNIRMGLNKNLGFKEVDRIENIRRIAEVSKLMNEAGIIVLTAFISPYIHDRENARQIIGENFIEIYVSTPLEECERRDVKGLYKKARSGEIPSFTGISSAYEKPLNPEIIIDTLEYSVEEAADILIEKVRKYL